MKEGWRLGTTQGVVDFICVHEGRCVFANYVWLIYIYFLHGIVMWLRSSFACTIYSYFCCMWILMVGFAVQLKHFSMKNESLYSLKGIIYNMMASFFFLVFTWLRWVWSLCWSKMLSLMCVPASVLLVVANHQFHNMHESHTAAFKCKKIGNRMPVVVLGFCWKTH